MNDLETLRFDLAAERGLGPDAARFLVGETVAEVEASAAKLASLIGSAPEPAESLMGLFGHAPAEKQQRQRALIAALHGRREQPRDPSTGRWATGPFSFDGGARQPMAPPPESHDAWLTRVLASRAADAGAHFG